MKVVFSDRAYVSILAETAEKVQTETGGLFLGVVEGDTFYVIEAIDPGPKSVFEVAYFEYDREYTQHLINKVANLYEARLDLIGLWHRHPGSFDRFSNTDNGTNAKYARMRKQGAISALVNLDPDFRLTVYHVSQPCRYAPIKYMVGDEHIPERFCMLKTVESLTGLMVQGGSSDEVRPRLKIFKRGLSFESLFELIAARLDALAIERPSLEVAVLDDAAMAAILGEIIEDAEFLANDLGVKVSVTKGENCLTLSQETIEGNFEVHFTQSSESGSILLFVGEDTYLYDSGLLRRLCIEEANERSQRVAQGDSGSVSNRSLSSSIRNAIRLVGSTPGKGK